MIQDKRYIRTERLIRTEFFKMLEQEKYTDITVGKLCENAFISRNTFYAHYNNLDKLLNSLIEDLTKNQMVFFRRNHFPGGNFNKDALKADIDSAFNCAKENAKALAVFFKQDSYIDFSVRLTHCARKQWDALFEDFTGLKMGATTAMLSDIICLSIIRIQKNWILHPNEFCFEKAKELALSTQIHVFEALIDSIMYPAKR